MKSAQFVPGSDDRQVAQQVLGPTSVGADDPKPHSVPRQWLLMAPTLLAVVFVTAFVTFLLPDVTAVASIGSAVALCLASPFLGVLERRLQPKGWRRDVLVIGAIALAMLLFGYGMARWLLSITPPQWDVAVSAGVIVLLVANVLLEDRLVARVAATVGLWIGATCVGGTVQSAWMLALAGAVGVAIALRHARRASAMGLGRARRAREQRRAEQLLAEFEEAGQGWFWETDRQGKITYVTGRIASLLGKDVSEILGRPFTGLFLLETQGQESERTLIFHLSTRSSFQDLQVLAATTGEERWWSISGRPVLDKYNNFMGFRGSGTDLTESRRSQQHVTQLARYDALTQLANRFQMDEWLGKILESPQVDSRTCAVFLLDLDHFKQVNDTMGHPAGDALLRQLAERLSSTVGERGRVGRLGGDEFQVILHGRQQREGLAHLARRIIENLSQPYLIDGSRVVIGASVGIALCPDDGATSDDLIRNADLALYAAKGRGRGRHHFYDDNLHSDAKERQQLEQDLRDAIATGALELHYQPQVRTTTERITSFEALLRWNHPQHGYMSPAKFVPVAEETGLVAQIGEWALRTACRDLAQWPEEVCVAVNVSPLQFANPALPAVVTHAIASAGIRPERLELEITESVFLVEDRSTEAMFNALKAIGVRLALDDFGTGYSSLGYLKRAPFDKIKIDQSFVRGATIEGSRNGAIIASIVSLAEALGMETTAEGVETLDELDLVRMLGCSHVQGYIYELPLSPAAALARLALGLEAAADGPRSSRAPRQTILRKVALEHAGHLYAGTIRNISQSGALVEGLWNVPPGTVFNLNLADSFTVTATAKWCKEGRMGIEFGQDLEIDAHGSLVFMPSLTRDRSIPTPLRQTA
ncbi:EAL domain-containing protein [Novosphingobium sp. Rr 2-17]|uniref:EAL domain-containing protein n=1 Tax=Novosphingobium sp. Rr 2-17 TaxID=555793 RepID=UPI00063F6621|nr:EAL domain-containing protein [Novosphingobium sp. Rr 2-17]